MSSRTRTPRRWARSSASAPSEVRKFHEKMSISAPSGVELMDRMMRRKIFRRWSGPPTGLLNVGPGFGVKWSGAAEAGAPAGTISTVAARVRARVLTSMEIPSITGVEAVQGECVVVRPEPRRSQAEQFLIEVR